MKKEQLDNLTKGSRPSLHPCTPNWQTLKGLVARAKDSIADASKKTNSAPTRFAAAYGAAFWLARAALEACGYRPAGSEGHRVAVFQNLANTLDWDASRWRPLDDMHKLRTASITATSSKYLFSNSRVPSAAPRISSRTS